MGTVAFLSVRTWRNLSNSLLEVWEGGSFCKGSGTTLKFWGFFFFFPGIPAQGVSALLAALLCH